MNQFQTSSAGSYITADIVHRNQAPVSQPVFISDVFDIPDIVFTPEQVYAPPITIPLQLPQLPPAPAPAPAPAAAPAPVTAINFIKAINHSAMTDIMNQSMVRNAQNTPSVGTKQTGVSIQVNKQVVPATAPATAPAPATASATAPATAPASVPTSHPISPPGSIQVITNNHIGSKHHVRKLTTNSKIVIEDEDKDTAIDYDDEDPEIKKIKLSLFHFAKDITFNLIFTIPFLRTKLTNILKEPSLAINQIERVFDEFKDQLNRMQLESLKKYVCEDGIRDKLNYILESGFNKILSDGKIDINDAPQFNQLVYFIIKSFNNINQGKVYRFYVSSEHVMLLLHFILKSVFTLTLKGNEEQMAIGLLDTSFKLIQIEVLPLISKRWYHRFRVCHSVREIEELIE